MKMLSEEMYRGISSQNYTLQGGSAGMTGTEAVCADGLMFEKLLLDTHFWGKDSLQVNSGLRREGDARLGILSGGNNVKRYKTGSEVGREA